MLKKYIIVHSIVRKDILLLVLLSTNNKISFQTTLLYIYTYIIYRISQYFPTTNNAPKDAIVYNNLFPIV